MLRITPRGRTIGEDEPPLQDMCVDPVEVPYQSTGDILLIDPQHRDYENLPNDETDERNEYEFYESDEQCSDEKSNDESK